jgi:hypothetical protein
MIQRKQNRLYESNIRIAFKVLLEWGYETLRQRQVTKKLKEMNANRGNIVMFQNIIKFLWDSNRIVDEQITYSLDDLDTLVAEFIEYNRKRIANQIANRIKQE